MTARYNSLRMEDVRVQELSRMRTLCDGTPSHTYLEQRAVEDSILQILMNNPSSAPILLRSKQFYYLFDVSKTLPGGFSSLDASRTWIAFWVLHSLELLGILDSIMPLTEDRFVQFFIFCQSPSGGFGGGPGQLAHLAPSYAAVMSLAILGTPTALEIIDRQNMYQFLLKMKQSDGSFTMHVEGESDLRSTYCALSIAKLLGILSPQLTRNCREFIRKCQTYEGGFGGEPGNEAHGGYTYCGMASLVLLEETSCIDLQRVLRWASSRQMSLEGGFQGRTNKLVDACYSFWVGALFPMIGGALGETKPLFDHVKLESYILEMCQGKAGGFKDKPGKHVDPYHTCYAMSGLSISQHASFEIAEDPHNILVRDLSTFLTLSIKWTRYSISDQIMSKML